MADANALYVAREDDLASLWNHWESTAAGNPQFVRLQAPFGGGRRALVGETLRRISADDPDAIVERANLASYYAGADGRSEVRMIIRDAQGRQQTWPECSPARRQAN